MQSVTKADLSNLYFPPPDSHKGQNGRLLIIGGSHLFHAASLWALTVASRIVDLVHYCSVPENNQIVHEAKSEFRNGIVIHRDQIEEYIEEDDCILIGPGMNRLTEAEIPNPKSQIPNNFQIQNIKELEVIEDEGLYTKLLTNYLLAKCPHKQWVIDAGALQMMDPALIPPRAILTPHHGEFIRVFGKELSDSGLASGQNLFDPLLAGSSQTYVPTPSANLPTPLVSELGKRSTQILPLADQVSLINYIAKKHSCIVLLKGQIDIACSQSECRIIEGGNAGMTKGGTGDVLAGLIAALACKNNPYLSTIAGSYINKAAGDELYKTVGPFFNSTDLANQIPQAMKRLLKF